MIIFKLLNEKENKGQIKIRARIDLNNMFRKYAHVVNDNIGL